MPKWVRCRFYVYAAWKFIVGSWRCSLHSIRRTVRTVSAKNLACKTSERRGDGANINLWQLKNIRGDTDATQLVECSLYTASLSFSFSISEVNKISRIIPWHVIRVNMHWYFDCKRKSISSIVFVRVKACSRNSSITFTRITMSRYRDEAYHVFERTCLSSCNTRLDQSPRLGSRGRLIRLRTLSVASSETSAAISAVSMKRGSTTWDAGVSWRAAQSQSVSIASRKIHGVGNAADKRSCYGRMISFRRSVAVTLRTKEDKWNPSLHPLERRCRYAQTESKENLSFGDRTRVIAFNEIQIANGGSG